MHSHLHHSLIKGTPAGHVLGRACVDQSARLSPGQPPRSPCENSSSARRPAAPWSTRRPGPWPEHVAVSPTTCQAVRGTMRRPSPGQSSYRAWLRRPAGTRRRRSPGSLTPCRRRARAPAGRAAPAHARSRRSSTARACGGERRLYLPGRQDRARSHARMQACRGIIVPPRDRTGRPGKAEARNKVPLGSLLDHGL